MRTVLWGSLRAHARRYVAAGLAIVMSVAFMVVVNVLSGSARDGMRAEVETQYAGADAVVAAEWLDDGAFDRVVDALAEVHGVEAVAGHRSGFLEVDAGAGKRLMNVSTYADAAPLRWQQVTEGTAPEGPREALMSTSTAERGQVALGDTIEVSGFDGVQKVVVSGFTARAGGDLGASLYVSERTAKRLGDALSSSAISVRTASGTDTAALVSTLEDAAAQADPDGDHPAMERDDWVQERVVAATKDVDVLQRLVLVFAAVAAFVGTLVIANTVTVVLAQRRRELALLRCVGATRKQVLRSLRVESLALGVAASAVGVLVGAGLGWASVAALKAWTTGITLGAVSLSIAGVAIPFALGVAVAVGATVLPARRVARLAPLEALRPYETVGLGGRAGAVRGVLGILLVAAGAAGLAVGTGDRLPVGLAGGMASFLGVVVLAPLLVPALLRLVGPVVRRSGVPGALAAGNVVRNPRRTASTSTALLIGVTLITMVLIGTASLRTTVEAELDSSYALDAAVVSAQGPLAEDAATRVAGIEGVEDVATLRGGEVTVDGIRVLALEVDDDARAVLRGDLVAPEPGALVLGGEFLEALDLGYGQEARVGGAGKTLTLTPRGGGSLGEVVLVAPGVLAELGVKTQPRAVWARADDGAPAEDLMAEVATVAVSGGGDIAGSLIERDWITLQLDVLLAVVVGLLAVAVLIAAVGMAGTLSLSVLERSRENALLRALGLSRRGMRTTLAVEALLMAGVGAVLGTMLGGAYGWLGLRALTDGIISDLSLAVPWAQVAVVLFAAAALGLLASVLPARRAARTAPAEGITAM